MGDHPDAVVVGAGPNGLVAALTLARAGWKVIVLEAGDRPGGGSRTDELTLPGFLHDVCSAIHPLGIASPALRDLGLEDVGVRWVHPEVPLAHMLRPDRAVVLHRSLEATAEGLAEDGPGWTRLLGPPVRAGFDLTDSLLSPLDLPPRHPVELARFGTTGIRSATSLGRTRFSGEAGPALLAGLAAHSMLELDRPITGGFGILLGTLAHSVGWPVAEGGSGAITDGLVELLESAGGEVRCGHRITSLGQLPPARAVLFDVTPRQLLSIAEDRLPSLYRWALRRFRHGPGVFKVDWALDGPVPWTDPAAGRAGTVHIGGTMAEVCASEAAVNAGRHADQPFLLVGQQSVADPTRAPAGAHTLWGYCHVPHGSDRNMTDAVERRIERFAPGFRDRILARHSTGPAALQTYNGNYVGGDISGGVADARQFLFRPVPSIRPWATPARGIYLCSSSTPPGGGVHGMCGRAAADAVLTDARRGRL
jgi:phytoene dehydrogenase-like protein